MNCFKLLDYMWFCNITPCACFTFVLVRQCQSCVGVCDRWLSVWTCEFDVSLRDCRIDYFVIYCYTIIENAELKVQYVNMSLGWKWVRWLDSENTSSLIICLLLMLLPRLSSLCRLKHHISTPKATHWNFDRNRHRVDNTHYLVLTYL